VTSGTGKEPDGLFPELFKKMSELQHTFLKFPTKSLRSAEIGMKRALKCTLIAAFCGQIF
jgi:hypothetical protein